MNQPKSKDILKVINNFKKVIKRFPDGELDMGIAAVNRSHDCGTVHCHGGWYAVATCDLGKCLEYNDGAIKMCQDLGFESIYILRKWADRNPGIWGNHHGRDMFRDRVAFFQGEKRCEGAKNLQHIVDHWEEVYERVKQGEV